MPTGVHARAATVLHSSIAKYAGLSSAIMTTYFAYYNLISTKIPPNALCTLHQASIADRPQAVLQDKLVSCFVLFPPSPADGSLLAAVQEEGHLPELTARWYFQQLTCALDYCHKKGVANRDIKLDNLLIDRSVYGRTQCPILKVCDWGYAKSEVLQSLATSRVVSAGSES